MNLLLSIQRGEVAREVRLARDAHAALSEAMGALADRFVVARAERRGLEPGLRAEDAGVRVLEVALPEYLWRCRAALPNDVQALTEDSLREQPPVALVAVDTGASPRFSFQALGGRRVLQQGRALLFNPRAFGFNRRPGLVVADRLDAVHKEGRLYFSSEHTVRRFLSIGRGVGAARREVAQ